MAFTYDLATTVGQIRLAIADTTSTAYAFEDAELTYFYTLGLTVDVAAIYAMRALLVSRALRVKRFSIGGQYYDDTAQVAAIRDWLTMYGGAVAAALPTATSIEPAVLPFDGGYVEVLPT